MNIQYKCPKCGGALEFEAGAQNVKCPYCDTEFPIEIFAELDKELSEQAEDNVNFETSTTEGYSESEASGMVSYLCESCGAEIVTDATTSATSCPYCDNPIVMQGNLKGHLKPELIIPFKLDKAKAMDAFSKHLSGKKLLPRSFVSNNHLEEVKGIYVPFWLYDSDADASIAYQAIRENNFSDSDYDVNVKEYFSVFRAGDISFENVPVDGSKKLENNLTESVEPYDFSEAVPFASAYMAGYYADKYDVTSEACSERAGQRMVNSTAEEFKKTVTGYTSVNVSSSHINIKRGTAKYVLLPMWLLTTKWNDTVYTFAMNGQTGKFVGNLPCDNSLKKKYFFKTFLSVACIAFLVMCAVLLIINLL